MVQVSLCVGCKFLVAPTNAISFEADDKRDV